MVRETSKSSRDKSFRDPRSRAASIVAPPRQRARSLAADLGSNDQVIAREVIARADEDFAGIFGSE
jgi:hypothetical protein